jgi:surface protein
MNANLGKWVVTKVKTLERTFYGASTFTGEGLESWITTAVTTLYRTFDRASSMNANLGKWVVTKVKTLERTFYGASTFTGGGLESWITTAVTTLSATFNGASSMNANLGKWDVAKVKTLDNTFQSASKFNGTGLDKWVVSPMLTSMSSTFSGASAVTSCSKRTIADAWGWKNNLAFYSTYYTAWDAEKCPGGITRCVAGTWSVSGNAPCAPCAAASTSCTTAVSSTCTKTTNYVCHVPGAPLTEWDFKQATWDVVNLDTAATTSKWGVLAKWDVSGVKDFRLAFSANRNEAGSYLSNGNSKARVFTGVGLESWNTTAAFSLWYTFDGASAMNSDLSAWNVAKVTTLESTFKDALTFKGLGLQTWSTTSVTTLRSTFDGASVMNGDLSAWDVAKVTNLESAFRRAAAFKAQGISTWNLVDNTIISVGLDSFYFTLSIPSCTRWLIVRNWPDSAEMKTLYANWNDYGTGTCESGSQAGKRCDSKSDCGGKTCVPLIKDGTYPDDGELKCQVR